MRSREEPWRGFSGTRPRDAMNNSKGIIYLNCCFASSIAAHGLDDPSSDQPLRQQVDEVMVKFQDNTINDYVHDAGYMNNLSRMLIMIGHFSQTKLFPNHLVSSLLRMMLFWLVLD